ncbi:MAG: hypothetical protein V3V72_11900 [Ignavibacteriaceae bacterium]
MAECSFQFKLETDPAETIEKVKVKIEQAGGMFNGDRNEGKFSLPTPVGVIEGSYNVTADELKIDITKKPAFLPCSMLEAELKKRF